MTIPEIFNFTIPTKPDQRLPLGNLRQDSNALALSEIANKHSGVILVITPDTLTASRLEAAIKFFSPSLEVLNFPDWETLPYDHFSPHEDIISQRLLTLTQLPFIQHGILLVSITTLLQRLPPLNYIQSTGLLIQCGEKRRINDMREGLQKAGYHEVSQVLARGEFAVRGSILDIFPMGCDTPYRIDFFDDEIDTIRKFDPNTQLSTEKLSKLKLLPAKEFPLSETAISLFRQQWRENFIGNPLNCPLYEAVSRAHTPAGIEYYLPLFFSQTQLLLDYLPDRALLVEVNELHGSAQSFWQEINKRFEQLRHDVERPIVTPEKLFIGIDELFASLKRFPRVLLKQTPINAASDRYNFNAETFPDIRIDHKLEQPLIRLKKFLHKFLAKEESRVLFCVESAGRREVLLDLLKSLDTQPQRCETWDAFLKTSSPIHIAIAPLEEGFYFLHPPYALITESQLFDQHVTQRQRKTKKSDNQAIIRNLTELNVGSPVVHIDHGIGRYCGLEHIKVGEHESEFLILEYANNAKLYVPIASLDLISRYSGGDLEHAPLHHLGSDQWQKVKQKAALQMRDVAAELLDVYARREAQKGFSFALPGEDYRLFSAQFPFTETVDQTSAIQQVINDMTSDRPMDRLVCGDVGFGKTEVAMRAAFLAIQSNKQVIILVPTTLLAQQHYQNFSDRFAEWPVQIDVISRFRSAAEQKTIQARLKLGAIDILIGTHKLLDKKLKFLRLGLLIIDEEHRFGVQQKERLKALRSEVDILSLTATPIPRTLHMAFSGLRELSIIATPPARRLSIKTFVQIRNTSLMREAILRELLRGGQVYFLHNQVGTIEKTARELEVIVPEARIQIAHGQLRERELERIMAEFYHQRFNVLVCTTIIETGIDIPSANTIIIDRADKFGLAQLHQLRGRVGRSHHQAYAYLMTPPKNVMTADAVKRLNALSSLEDLGAGFTLATHDLEIRGAGELLGEQQSGNMHNIGFSLYMELLEQSVQALKTGKLLTHAVEEIRGTEINLQISALIPDTYLPDVHTRLVLYKRIANTKNKGDLESLQVEMIDRFGLLPQAAKNLFQITELKLIAQQLGIKKINVGATGGLIEFNKTPNINYMLVIQLIQNNPSQYKMEGPSCLRFNLQQKNDQFIIQYIFDLFSQLSK